MKPRQKAPAPKKAVPAIKAPALDTPKKVHKSAEARNQNQHLYLKAIDRSSLVFGIGPAGTGKTFLAVSAAVTSLLAKKSKRIVLVRPAVEAGERLGFLPGTLQEKVDPYMRPLFDALFTQLGPDATEALLQKNIIEIAPLAFMRGRTLDDAFVILDEAQNTTSEQMKMFLTRLGASSKMVVTGDITQIDLPNPKKSGLLEALELLEGLNDIEICHFTSEDIVRHPLVQAIVDAYGGKPADEKVTEWHKLLVTAGLGAA